MRWTEGHIHLAMRHVLRHNGWTLIAGEFPGGSDHELYPLNVVDPKLAKDYSPDPRRHSLGELIPDLVALNGRDLFVGEAKVNYNLGDQLKLLTLTTERKEDFLRALTTFAADRNCQVLLPVETLIIYPTLIFRATGSSPEPDTGMSYLRIVDPRDGFFEGELGTKYDLQC